MLIPLTVCFYGSGLFCLQEICLGGMVLETNIGEVITHVEGQNKLEKSENSPTMSIKVGNTRHYSGVII